MIFSTRRVKKSIKVLFSFYIPVPVLCGYLMYVWVSASLQVWNAELLWNVNNKEDQEIPLFNDVI